MHCYVTTARMHCYVIAVALLLFHSTDAQSCQDSCRTVCDPTPNYSLATPESPIFRGKMGPKGDRGPKGDAGPAGRDCSAKVFEIERGIDNIKRANEKMEAKINNVSAMLVDERRKNDQLSELVERLSS